MDPFRFPHLRANRLDKFILDYTAFKRRFPHTRIYCLWDWDTDQCRCYVPTQDMILISLSGQAPLDLLQDIFRELLGSVLAYQIHNGAGGSDDGEEEANSYYQQKLIQVERLQCASMELLWKIRGQVLDGLTGVVYELRTPFVADFFSLLDRIMETVAPDLAYEIEFVETDEDEGVTFTEEGMDIRISQRHTPKQIRQGLVFWLARALSGQLDMNPSSPGTLEAEAALMQELQSRENNRVDSFCSRLPDGFMKKLMADDN